jgi:3-oxoacyl-[acyl-carrier-protein] synthase-3
MVASGRALPAASISNDDLSQRVATDDAWIRSRTGIGARRVAGPGETVTSLAAEAGRAALAHEIGRASCRERV